MMLCAFAILLLFIHWAFVSSGGFNLYTMLHDILINEQYIDPTSSLSRDSIEIKNRMSKKNVTIIGLGKNVEKHFVKVLRQAIIFCFLSFYLT